MNSNIGNIYHPGYWLLLLILMGGCSEDFFSKTIEVESEWAGPQVVVQARMNTSDDSLALLLHYSKPVFGKQNNGIQHISDALVRLSGDNGSNYEFSFDTLRNTVSNYFAIASPGLEEGVKYTLTIEIEGLERMTAVQTMPSAMKLDGYKWTENYRKDLTDSIDYTLLELSYQAGSNELFSSHILQVGSRLQGDTIFVPAPFNTTRFEFSNFEFQYELFDHLSLSNNEKPTALYEIDTETLNSFSLLPDPFIRVYATAITQDDYLFHETVSAHSLTSNIPFVEAVIVYSNISNAHGNFSLINTREFDIALP